MARPLSRLAIGLGLVLSLIAGLVVADVGSGGIDQKRGKLEGTWEFTFENAPQHRQVKIINQTHFVWVTYDRQSGLPLLSGGGTYTFHRNTYTEKYEFGSNGLPQELVGKEQVFTAEVDATTWVHAGTLTNGFVVRERWRRVE